MKGFFIFICKFFLQPISMAFFKSAQGLENIPQDGPFILASNHNDSLDHWYITHFLFKNLKKVRFIGALDDSRTRLISPVWYYFSETIAVQRNDDKSKEMVTQEAIKSLKAGKIVIAYPEGHFSYKDRLLKGRAGVAIMALESGVPVVPMGIEVDDDYKHTIRFGKPLDFSKEEQIYFQTKGKDYSACHVIIRETVDKIMVEISKLCNKKYLAGNH